MTGLETIALFFAGCGLWLLSGNRPFGWWVSLVGFIAHGLFFYRFRLFADVAIQGFYFATSLVAVWIWLRGGAGGAERPVGRAPRSLLFVTAVLGVLSVLALVTGNVAGASDGAIPFWNATLTALSLIAHLYLVARYVESWYVWIAVNGIYIAVYASRGVYAKSLIYAVFLLLAFRGLVCFRRRYEGRGLASVSDV